MNDRLTSPRAVNRRHFEPREWTFDLHYSRSVVQFTWLFSFTDRVFGRIPPTQDLRFIMRRSGGEDSIQYVCKDRPEFTGV